MKRKELKRLSRTDLLEMLIDQSEELNALRERLETAEAELKKRDIAIENAGSIAEAALQLNDVFSAAQAACTHYMDNIHNLSDRQTEACRAMERDSREQADKMLADARRACERMRVDASRRCEKMVAEAETQAKAYWADVSVKLQGHRAYHAALNELLSVTLPKR